MINTDNLYVGQVVKNYYVMCALLEDKVKKVARVGFYNTKYGNAFFHVIKRGRNLLSLKYLQNLKQR